MKTVTGSTNWEFHYLVSAQFHLFLEQMTLFSLNYWRMLIDRTVLKTYTEHPVVKTAYSLTAKETMMKRQLCTLQLKQIQQREKEGKQLSKNDVNLEILI